MGAHAKRRTERLSHRETNPQSKTLEEDVFDVLPKRIFLECMDETGHAFQAEFKRAESEVARLQRKLVSWRQPKKGQARATIPSDCGMGHLGQALVQCNEGAGGGSEQMIADNRKKLIDKIAKLSALEKKTGIPTFPNRQSTAESLGR